MHRSNFFGLRLMQGLVVLVLLSSISICYSQNEESGSEENQDDPIMNVIEGSLEQYKERDVDSAGGTVGSERPEPPSVMGMLFQLVFALGITLVLIYLTVALLKRFFFKEQKSKSPHIRVLSRSFLSPKTVVYLVAVPGKVLVIGEGQGGISALAELPYEGLPENLQDMALSPETQKNFAQELSKIETEMNPVGLVPKIQSAISSLQEKSRTFPRRKE